MSRPTESTQACERYEQLRHREAESRITEASDLRFLRNHREACSDCQTLQTVVETIQWPANEDADAPCESLDELTRRRLIYDAVAQANEAPSRADETPARADETATRAETVDPKPSSRISFGGICYLTAASAVLLGLAILWSPWHRGPVREIALSPSGAMDGGARFLLLAGVVRTTAGSAALNRAIQPGQWLQTAPGGSAVLRLPGGATVLLNGQTRLRLGVKSITLERGALLALVDPQQPGMRFTVVTGQGRVEVTGTVFQVTANAVHSQAAVLRGRVRVKSAQHPPVQLLAGHQIRVGAQRTRALSPATSRRLWQQVRLLDLLKTDRPATLVVTSRPVGARVVVDGVGLGNTPLVVSLRPGHRRLELSAEGHQAVREHVLLTAQSKTSRDFDLKPTQATAGVHTTAMLPPVRRTTAHTNRSRSHRHQPPKRPLAQPPTQTPPDLRRALLNRAQILRAARDWRGAANAYRDLIRRYPGSAEAATALVSVGVLQLRHLGQPARALRTFGRYLKGSGRGALAREAAYGQILALRSLGRRSQEISALRRFLKRYPAALQAAKVKRRLGKMTHGAKSKPEGRSKPKAGSKAGAAAKGAKP